MEENVMSIEVVFGLWAILICILVAIAYFKDRDLGDSSDPEISQDSWDKVKKNNRRRKW